MVQVAPEVSVQSTVGFLVDEDQPESKIKLIKKKAMAYSTSYITNKKIDRRSNDLPVVLTLGKSFVSVFDWALPRRRGRVGLGAAAPRLGSCG